MTSKELTSEKLEKMIEDLGYEHDEARNEVVIGILFNAIEALEEVGQIMKERVWAEEKKGGN